MNLLSVGQTECLYVVRVGELAYSNLLISVTSDYMTVARRYDLMMEIKPALIQSTIITIDVQSHELPRQKLNNTTQGVK